MGRWAVADTMGEEQRAGRVVAVTSPDVINPEDGYVIMHHPLPRPAAGTLEPSIFRNYVEMYPLH
jgi:hypothetical protein